MDNKKRINDSCWIYIMELGDNDYAIGITGDLYRRMEIFNNKYSEPVTKKPKLIYWRQFPDTLSALGFKLLLQKLEPRSVDFIISQMNPKRDNLI